ncbi:hypothetical protein CASFOL_027081 [Castilleja foliolosa]|uniref:Mucin-like protein n=1 Tax=Castilleja foliolosa TaxID=1961234 RepID=A0ABD3CJV5_9LAMI
MTLIHRLTSILRNPNLNPTTAPSAAAVRLISTNRTPRSNKSGEDEWNDAWETARLPGNLSGKSPRAPWESDVSFSLTDAANQNPQNTLPASLPEEMDPETQAFVEDMNDNWDQRKGKSVKKDADLNAVSSGGSASSSSSLYSLENIKRDYRLTKQKIHAGLWVKEIEKLEEAKLGNSFMAATILRNCSIAPPSIIFDSANNNNDFGDPKIADSEFKNKPDGWETTAKSADGNVWDMSQREEDILVQEFERRIAFNKFQIASFIKTHIFSRRRPIDGWKYMIEEIGPNARKGKGSVSRLASVSDESTQPFREEKPGTFASTYSSSKGR